MVKQGQLRGINALTGKMKKLSFKLLEEPCTTKALQMVHLDVRGPITPQSQEEEYKYWIIIVDNFCSFP
ncbi:hypothetical protein PAXRUDRAFT_58193, partial [Paxillus rubicundulus Ve08.2h10]